MVFNSCMVSSQTESLLLLQTFDIRLLRVTTGGASLGTDTTVRVGILKNDSPNGVFSFVAVEVRLRVGFLWVHFLINV